SRGDDDSSDERCFDGTLTVRVTQPSSLFSLLDTRIGDFAKHNDNVDRVEQVARVVEAVADLAPERNSRGGNRDGHDKGRRGAIALGDDDDRVEAVADLAPERSSRG
ncbi:Hypothetical predicted protein, partial [Paramuricea clavata]